MTKYDRIEVLSFATKQAIKNLKIRRTPSGIPRPTEAQAAEVKAIEANWHRALLQLLNEP